MTVAHRTKKHDEWFAWSSELGDLRRLAQLFINLVEERRETIVREMTQRHEAENAPAVTRERHAAELTESWQATAEFEDGDDQVDGPVMQVLTELDRRSVRKLTFKANGGFSAASGEYVNLTFDRTAVIHGVQLQVRSNDPGWARKVLSSFSEEVARGIPKWSRWRSVGGRTLMSIIVAVTLWMTTALLMPPGTPQLVTLLIAIAVSLSGQTFVSRRAFINWLFPPFEVTSDSGTSTGGRRLAALLAIIASIVISVVVNLLTG